jgi:hypothetical protein
MEKILLAHLNALHFGGIALVLSALSSWKKRTVVPWTRTIGNRVGYAWIFFVTAHNIPKK